MTQLKSYLEPLARRPWLLIILAFAFLLGAWSALITLAIRNPSTFVPLKSVATARP